jgi:AcrR family transcriptional regulator
MERASFQMVATIEQPATRLSRHDARQKMYEELILEGAEREFARVGFADTKVQDIARTSDVSLATVYKTFPGKGAIYDAVHGKRMAELIEFSTSSLGAIASPFDRLLAAVSKQVEYFAGHPNYLRMHIRDGLSWATASGISGISRQTAVETWRAGIAMMTDGIEAAIDSGEMIAMRPELLTQLVIAALQVWLTDWIETEVRVAPSTVAAELVEYLRRSFTRTDPRSRRS